VARAVESFIRSPTGVESRCGLGPDYVPPAPDAYDVPDVADLPPPPTQPTAPTTAPPAPLPLPTPTTRACPTGTVSIGVDELVTTAVPDEPGWWQVDVRGVVSNATSASVRVDRVEATVDVEPVRSTSGEPEATLLDAGATTGWTARAVVYADEAPEHASATVAWSWDDPDDWACATPGSA
jgi:hypothetical protein